LGKPKFTGVEKQILNHMQVTDLKNILWINFNKCFARTSQKHKFGHNLIFINLNGMNPIALDSPSKCVTEEFNLASKFILFLK
jgi:hypothetical protein